VSVAATTWVWNHSQSGGNDRLVLLAIADAADAQGANAWPRVSTIAAMAGLSARTVQRCIASLVKLGELEVERQAGGGELPDRWRPNRYRIPLVENQAFGATA
jgi:hypothetical protein